MDVSDGAVRFQAFQAFGYLLEHQLKNVAYVLTIQALSKIKTFAGRKTGLVMKGLLRSVVWTG